MLTAGQAGISGENALLQALQVDSGGHPQVSVQPLVGPPVFIKRVGLPAAAVQRQHVLAAQPLAVGMLADHLTKLGYYVTGSAAVQIELDALLEQPEPQLLQTGSGGRHRLHVKQPAVRWPAPDREG